MLAQIAAPDSATVAHAVADGVNLLLSKFLPGVDPAVSQAILKLIAAPLAVGVVALSKRLISGGQAWASKVFVAAQDGSTPWLAAHKTWLYPALGMAAGWVLNGFHLSGAVLGLAGVGAHQLVTGVKTAATKTDTAGVQRAKLGALILLLGLGAGMLSPGSASAAPEKVSFLSRVGLQARMGVRDVSPFGATTALYVAPRLMFVLSNRVGLQLDVVRPLRNVGKQPLGKTTEYDLSVGWTFF